MSRPSVRRLVRTGALAIVATLLLAGCVSWFQPPATSSTSTPTGEKVASALRPFYDQKLVWKSCGSNFDCTTAKVPLDWSDPSGSTIRLALTRHRATGKRIGSLLVNPGGPGASGYDFVHDSLTFAVDAKLIARYDVVGFDPRGVGRSNPVKCTTSPKQLDAFLYDIIPGAPGSPQSLAASAAQYKAFGAACKRLTGPLLGHVDTASAARDMDVLRAALGDRKLHYLGYSYGTFLGSTYAGLFPKKTGRLVLDGALDPTTTTDALEVVQAQGFEDNLRAYLRNCLSTTSCPFRGDTLDQALTTIQGLLAAVDAQPIRNSDGRELGSDTLVTAIIYPLYSKDTWKYEDALFKDVEQGSARVAFILADAYNERSTKGTYADNSTQAFFSINCLDYPAIEGLATLQAQAAVLDRVAPTFGPYEGYDVSCANWPYQAVRTPAAITADGSAPIVVVGTTNDPATPYIWSKGLASQLQNGILITRKGDGHTGYNKGNTCVDGAVDGYLLDGTVPKNGLTC